jgi:uncharacterized Zn-binding protein involved in type VI secretion
MFAAGRRGDRSIVEGKTCGVCGKPEIGPAVDGSENVLINGRAAVRVNDRGEHTEGCGPGAWEAKVGAPAVLVNQRNAHRRGDGARHCCGQGALMEGSPNVMIGNRVVGGARGAPGGEEHGHEGGFHVVDDEGAPLVHVPYVIRTASGNEFSGRTDGRGYTELVFTEDAEDIEIEILSEPECRS